MVNAIRFVLVALCLAAPGCVAHEQVQHFEVIDPASGNVNYYRMTITGTGALAATYHVQAGYFSAASIDVLRGRMPEMPEADLPIEQDAAYDALLAGYYDALVASAGSRPAGDDLDATAMAHARLAWLGQLSPADVAAVGMNQSLNPFQFRKLVFWATSEQIDLSQFGAQIDAMIADATALVRAYKQQRADDQRRANGLRNLLRDTFTNDPALAPYGGLIDAILGTAKENDE